ncbi:MAG TPA: response regulator [Syntrophaceae bacterium]|nr:response regulator [Syntrophaceae bacterium]
MSKKMLIVDDEPDILKFFSTALEQNGFIPVIAEDGVEGMKKVIEEKPDLILLDIMMPEKGGIKMYSELKKDEGLRSIPVVIVTGIWEGAEMKGHVSVPEPEGHLQKPVEPNNLIKTIGKILA